MVETRSGAVLTPEPPRKSAKKAAKEAKQRLSVFAVLGVALLATSVLPQLAPLHFTRSVFNARAFGPKASTFTQALGAAKAVRDQLAEGEVSEAAREAGRTSLRLVKRLFWPFSKQGSLYESVRDRLTGEARDPGVRLQEAWEGLYQDAGVPVLWKTLVHYAASGLASAGILCLVLHGALVRDRLHLDLYRRLLQGLAVFGVGNAIITLLNYAYFEPAALASLLGTFLAVGGAAGYHLSRNARGEQVPALDPRPRTARGATYAALTTFASVGGLLILLLPKATIQGVFGVHGGAVGRILWQLNATGVHQLVSFCLLNLKPLAESHHLNTQTSALLNAATILPGLTYLLWGLRCAIAGLSGGLMPVLLLTWATAAAFAALNLPANPHTKRYD